MTLDYRKPNKPTDIAFIEPFLPVGTDKKQIKEPLSKGKCCSNVTSDYLRPERWMPRDIYRFYFENSDDEDAGNEGFVIYIGVILDQEKAWAGFAEPWISCAIYRISPEFDTKKIGAVALRSDFLVFA